MSTIVITGTNRGIGLEFVGQYAQLGWEVIATCRDPAAATALRALATRHPGVTIAPLDLASSRSIEAFADGLAGRPVDVLLNNAALLGPGGPQLLGQWEDDAFLDAFRVNALGPARLTERLLPQVSTGQQRRVVFLGSAAGAIGLLHPPANLYAYRASKAALHLIARNLALDLEARGITVALINPGLVDTRGLLDLAPDDPGPPDLQHVVRLVRQGVVPLIRPPESVAAMIRLIAAWTPEQSGTFLNYDGTPVPW